MPKPHKYSGAMSSEPSAAELWPGRSEVQELVPGLCITNNFGAMKRSKLRAAGITRVIMCARELEARFPNDFAYDRLRLADNTTEDLRPELFRAIGTIDRVISREGGRVLLHCAAGASRSGAVAVGYLMWSRDWSLEEALEAARAARPIVNPNEGFREQLARFREEGWNGLPPPSRGTRTEV